MATLLNDFDDDTQMTPFSRAVSLSIPSVLCGALMTVPGPLATSVSSVIELPAAAIAAVAGDATMVEISMRGVPRDDIAPRDVTTSELTSWGHSMMGGDTSGMLDI